MPGIWNNMCYVRYRMNEAKIWYGMDICNASTPYMCSVLSRCVICYLYQLIHVVLCFAYAAFLNENGETPAILYKYLQEL